MAGNYPDPPGYRMAYDRDGSEAYLATNSAFGAISSQLSQADMQALNREAGLYSLRNRALVVIFPELRDLDAVWTYGSFSTIRCETSSNTTNGIDGTWTSYGNPRTSSDGSPPSMRENIYHSTVLGIRAIRLAMADQTGSGGGGLHLYGEPSSTPERLEFWDPVLDQKIGPAAFDWGDVQRSSTSAKEFRIKNLSDILTATGVRVAMEILSDTTPSVTSQHQISQDGGATWASQQTIGDLAPGAVSQVMKIRENIDEDAILSLWSLRMFAEALTWEVAS